MDGGGIIFIIENHGSAECIIGIDDEEVIMGNVLVDIVKLDYMRIIDVRVDHSKLTDDRTYGQVFHDFQAAEGERGGKGVGYRICIQRIGGVSQFGLIRISVPVYVAVIGIFDSILIQIFNHIEDINSEVLLNPKVVLVTHFYPDRIGTV